MTALPTKGFDLLALARRNGWENTAESNEKMTRAQLVLSRGETTFTLVWESRTSTSRYRLTSKQAVIDGRQRDRITYDEIAAHIEAHPAPLPELSEYDFMELVAFQFKVEWERSFPYTWSNYPPRFEAPELAEYGTVRWKFSRLYSRYKPKVMAWREEVGGERAVELHNAHIDERNQRRKDACLFGVRCEDGYVITCDTQAYRDRLWGELHEEAGKPHRRVPAALLVREVPGGAWAEVVPA
ncbi:hypothetical protein [Streptomyces sp. NPDC001492]